MIFSAAAVCIKIPTQNIRIFTLFTLKKDQAYLLMSGEGCWFVEEFTSFVFQIRFKRNFGEVVFRFKEVYLEVEGVHNARIGLKTILVIRDHIFKIISHANRRKFEIIV